MSEISASQLLQQTEQEFRAGLGPECEVMSSNLAAPESFRGGFRMVFTCGLGQLVASYGDMEFEVIYGARELFGHTVHVDFEGNMFSREHLKEYLPRIVASAIGQLRNAA